MFLDGKHLQMTQSYDKTNYLRSARPSSDLPPKLHVLVHSFTAHQGCETTSASYTSQISAPMRDFRSETTRPSTFIRGLLKMRNYLRKATRYKLVHPCATYALTLHVWVLSSQPTKDAELPTQATRLQKWRQA